MVPYSCGVVLVFWLRREIVFGVMYILLVYDTRLSCQNRVVLQRAGAACACPLKGGGTASAILSAPLLAPY